MTAKSAAIFASLLLISTPLRARQEDDNRQRIDLHLYYRHAGWVMGRPTPDDPKAADPTLTRYIFQSLVQAVDPQTGKPYQDTPEPPTCKPADLRMAFRLEKKEFLLGEPILVEFRVELDGPGHYAWSLGGDSTLGRDNTFLFILRNEDGAIVPDPYQKPEFNRGGLGSMPDVKQGAAVSSWLAIQRWCAIDRPGTYDLYCISGRYKQLVSGEHQARVAALPVEIRRDVYIDKNDQLMDVQRNKPSKWYELVLHPEMLDREESPLREQLPPDISAIAATSGLGALAHFKITIRNGTDSENAEMADRWTSLVEPVSARALNMAGARRRRGA
jgi:hypothetical protein